MGQLAFILGPSGSGKSYSLRNFKRGEVGVFSVAGKRLPFATDLPVMYNAGYGDVEDSMRRNKVRAYVVDDATYLMEFDNFDRIREKGYDKFTAMAQSFYGLLQVAIRETSPDTMTYFLLHPEDDGRGGEKIKTIGKMLDNQLCVEGLTAILLDARTVRDGDAVRHVFITQNDGYNLAKCPPDFGFAAEIDNDLKAVDTQVRKTWGMAPITDESEEQ